MFISNVPHPRQKRYWLVHCVFDINLDVKTMNMIPKELMYIYNNLGFTALELTGRDKNGYWQKWERFEVLMGQENVNWDNWSDRLIADVEIVLDYDRYFCTFCGNYVPKNVCKFCGRKYTPDEIHDNIKKHVSLRLTQLSNNGLKFALYSSAGKGYHIHLIFPQLRELSDRERSLFKSLFITYFGAELLKAGKRAMICRDGGKNRKTNNTKTILYCSEGFNYFTQENEGYLVASNMYLKKTQQKQNV